MNKFATSPVMANLKTCSESNMTPKLAAASKRQQEALRADVRALLVGAFKNKMPKEQFKAKLVALQSKHMNSATTQATIRSTVASCQKEIRAALTLLASALEKECKKGQKDACPPAKIIRDVLQRKTSPTITAKDYASTSTVLMPQ